MRIVIDNFPLGGHQFFGKRLFEFGDMASLKKLGIVIDFGDEAFLSRNRKYLAGGKIQRRCTIVYLFRDFIVDFTLWFEIVPKAVDLIEYDETAALCTSRHADVVVPDGEIGLCDAGIGRENEKHGMRVWQERERQFGFHADGVQSRRVQNDQAAF